jgi:hypothetical protein
VLCAEDENAGGFQEPFLLYNTHSEGRLFYFIYINESNKKNVQEFVH